MLFIVFHEQQGSRCVPQTCFPEAEVAFNGRSVFFFFRRLVPLAVRCCDLTMLFSLIYFWRQLLRLPPPWLSLHDRFCDFPSQYCFINFKAVISRSVMFVMCSVAGLFHKRLGLRCDSIIDQYRIQAVMFSSITFHWPPGLRFIPTSCFRYT